MTDKIDVQRPRISAAESSALIALFDAWRELKRLGWSEPRYFSFPADGTEFELIELGSTGIHRAVRRNGYCWVDHEWPSEPFLLRAAEELKDALRALPK